MSAIIAGAMHDYKPSFPIPEIARPFVRNALHWAYLLRWHNLDHLDPTAETTAMALLEQLNIVRYECGHYAPAPMDRLKRKYCSLDCKIERKNEAYAARYRAQHPLDRRGGAEAVAKRRATMQEKYGRKAIKGKMT